MMSNKALTLAAIVLGGVLFLLVILSALSSSFLNKKNTAIQVTPPILDDVPQSSDQTSQDSTQDLQSLSPEQERDLQKKVEEINRDILTPDEAQHLFDLEKDLPISNSDFDLTYSELLGQFFIKKKSANADSALQKLFSERGLSGLLSRRDMFRYVEVDVTFAKNQAEDEIVQKNVKRKDIKKSKSDSAKLAKKEEEEATKPLIDALRSMIDFPQQETGGSADSGPFEPSRAQNGLGEIFNAAGSKIGTPPTLIECTMSQECGRLLEEPAGSIAQYIQRGLPPDHFCYFNGTAYGPMQFVQGTWRGVANTINSSGGLSVSPNIENPRDAIWGAAVLLRNNGSPANPQRWAVSEISRASNAYNTGRGDGCNSYCQRVTACYQGGGAFGRR